MTILEALRSVTTSIKAWAEDKFANKDSLNQLSEKTDGIYEQVESHNFGDKNTIRGFAYPITGYGIDVSSNRSFTKFKVVIDEAFLNQSNALIGAYASVVLDYWKPRLGAISEISRTENTNEVIIKVNTYWIESHYAGKNYDSDGWFVLQDGDGKDNWFMLSDHHELGTIDTTYCASALGGENIVTQVFATAVGAGNEAHGKADFVAGQGNISDGYCGFTAGMGNRNNGEESSVFGNENTVNGDRSLVSGSNNTVDSNGSLVVGHGNNVTSDRSMISGEGNTKISGANNIVSGSRNEVENATGSILVGSENNTRNNNAGAVGVSNSIRGDNSFVSGEKCRVSKNSIAGGYESKTYGDNILAHGKGIKKSLSNATALGQFNKDDNTCLFEVGNGTSDTARSNAFEVTKSGVAFVGGKKIATEEFVLSNSGEGANVNPITSEQIDAICGTTLVDSNSVFTDESTAQNTCYMYAMET